jgi:tetratricopeptide (TPR) repeat protein
MAMPPGGKKNLVIVLGLLLIIAAGLAGGYVWWEQGISLLAKPPATPPQSAGFAGTVTCRECHEKFYQLWSTSHHGLAMQPVTGEFARTRIVPLQEDLQIGEGRYRVEIQDAGALMVEQGPRGEKRYPMEQALGGKNVYYFLTPLEKGRLQVLPGAFDVRRKEWFDTTASHIRHFAEDSSQPVNWRDLLLTFNTACYSCHVSQLSTNYDLKTDTYHTFWGEPGINCETCHGPGAEHVRVCREAPQGTVPADLKILSAKQFTVVQHNDTCSPCHAKMIPLTAAYPPGARFFDHFDLTTLEDRDFSPDGRDLGENYTFTLWRASPCVKSGKLSCLHCHTSSGRYRFKDEAKANQACLPCHAERVNKAAEHIKHPLEKSGTPGKCISCHMPMTEFARMTRSDHSMRPPTPRSAQAFKSSNACNLCHKDKDVAWADAQVRKWRPRDYQAPVLHRAQLIEAARGRDWSRLPEMLDYIVSPDRDEVFATSLIRLLAPCHDDRKWPALRQALKDPSPLVRGAAALALQQNLIPQNRDALLAATRDEYLLVRVRAAQALAAYPRELLSTPDQLQLNKATAELVAAFMSRPDDWTSRYNLGNYYFSRGESHKALESYAAASRLRPDSALPLVNASLVYARQGERGKAEEFLRRALEFDPENAAANFNLGLLLAEQGQKTQGEQRLRAALKADPNLAEAAYNLGVLLAPARLAEGLEFLRRADRLRPHHPRYAYSLAFYQRRQGDAEGAAAVLNALIQRHSDFAEAYLLLGEIYEKQGKAPEAKAYYLKALEIPDLTQDRRRHFQLRLQKLSPKN